MEARAGIEPTIKGFADLPLATWVPRHHSCTASKVTLSRLALPGLHQFENLAAIGNGNGLPQNTVAEEKILVIALMLSIDFDDSLIPLF